MKGLGLILFLAAFLAFILWVIYNLTEAFSAQRWDEATFWMLFLIAVDGSSRTVRSRS